MNNNKDLLSPEFQGNFWRVTAPEFSEMLKEFEGREIWSYKFNDIPELFKSLSEELPKISTMKANMESREAIRDLIPIISSMPMRECISAISWLDSNSGGGDEVGWGVMLYLECVSISNSKADDQTPKELKLHAMVVYQRVRIVLQAGLYANLFSNLLVDLGK